MTAQPAPLTIVPATVGSPATATQVPPQVVGAHPSPVLPTISPAISAGQVSTYHPVDWTVHGDVRNSRHFAVRTAEQYSTTVAAG